ncbi:MAG: hypothetical protein AAFO15_02610 [Pseudomonadota bacterium]
MSVVNYNIFYHIYIGFLCGITLCLNTFIFNCFIVSKGFSVIYIGYAYLSVLPYSCAFLWSYVFDFYLIRIFQLDNLRSWLLLMMFALAISLCFMSLYMHVLDFWYLVICNFFICIFSVSKDVLLGYWRINFDINAIDNSRYYAIGYRLGMVYVIFFSLHMISYGYSWNLVYMINMLFIVIALLLFLYLSSYFTLHVSIDKFNILEELYRYRYVVLALFLYNCTDRLLMSVLKKFLIDYNFTMSEIGQYKMIATFGLFVGYWIVGYINISLDNLFYAGIMHSLVHILLYVHAFIGKNYLLHLCIVILEGITGGVCMSLYFGYIARITNSIYIYALFNSVMGISNAILPIASGYFIYYFNWQYFFLFISVLGCCCTSITYRLLLYSR